MGFADRDVLCVDCDVMFVFSAGEQQFFQEMGFSHVAKHPTIALNSHDSRPAG